VTDIRLPGTSSSFSWSLLSLVLSGTLTLGCRAGALALRSEPRKGEPANEPAWLLPSLHRGAATDYVAAAGLRWLVVGRPSRIVQHSVLRQELSRLVPPDRLDKFFSATGIDLPAAPEALVAGLDYGNLYLVMTHGSNRLIEQRFRTRLASEPIFHRPDPRITRIAGLMLNTPQTLVSIEGLLVAFAVGDPTPARVVEGFATRRLTRSPTALEGAALSVLPKALDQADVRFSAPGPFPPEWQRGLRGLLGSTTALGVAAEPKERGKTLQVTVAVAGDFPDTLKAQELVEATWHDLTNSNLGRLVGLNVPHGEAKFSVTPESLGISVELEVAALLSGLEAAVSADVWKMMEMGPVDRGARPGTPRDNSGRN
jgi:hypothetical protein